MWTVSNICPYPEWNSNQCNIRLSSTIPISHFESLIQRNGRPSLNSLSVVAPISPLLTHQKSTKGLEQTMEQSKKCPLLQSLPRVLGPLSPLSTKRQHSWAAHMGLWALASSAPLGLAVFVIHTLGINVWNSSISLLHLLTRAWLMERFWWRLASRPSTMQGPLRLHQPRVLSF